MALHAAPVLALAAAAEPTAPAELGAVELRLPAEEGWKTRPSGAAASGNWSAAWALDAASPAAVKSLDLRRLKTPLQGEFNEASCAGLMLSYMLLNHSSGLDSLSPPEPMAAHRHGPYEGCGTAARLSGGKDEMLMYIGRSSADPRVIVLEARYPAGGLKAARDWLNKTLAR